MRPVTSAEVRCDMTRSDELTNRTWLLNVAASSCVLFGLAVVLNVQVAGDGMWFWYAKFLLAGRHLYGDLHLALQPLYVIVTAVNMRLFGEGWLVSKLPAAVLLAAYVLLLRQIAARLPLRDGPRAVLLLAAFAFPLLFEADRFDDYHVMADCFQVGAILVLLALPRAVTARAVLVRSAVLGGLSGLAMMSRLNDGGLLWVTVLVAIVAMAPLRRWVGAVVCAVVAALTAVATVLSTGDGLGAYASNSIFRAAGAKGGGKLLGYPFHLIVETTSHFTGDVNFAALAVLAAGLAVLVAFATARWMRRPVGSAGAGTVAFALTMLAYVPLLKANRWAITTLPRVVCASMVLLGLALGILTLLRAAWAAAGRTDGPRLLRQWNPGEILLLIPLGQLVSGSLSSGGEYLPLNAPIGILLLLLPFAYPAVFRAPQRAYGYAAVVGLTSLCCLAFKAGDPFSWQTYHNRAMLVGRQWYRHPVYGPMVIESDLLAFMQPMCARIHDTATPSVLSTPFPYANYFCNVAPWHDQVQSFFDTSTEQSIGQLMAGLQADPPHTVVYQRQMLNLLGHERIFNHYKPLPHRALDTMIVDRLNSGAWSVTHQQCVAESDWVEIETVPRASLPRGASVPFDANPYRCVRQADVDGLRSGDPSRRGAGR